MLSALVPSSDCQELGQASASPALGRTGRGTRPSPRGNPPAPRPPAATHGILPRRRTGHTAQPRACQSSSWAATISPIHAGLCVVAALVGGFGAIASASLIGYSPTRLAQHLDDARRPDKDARTAELDARSKEYFVVAAIYAATGWVVGLWALWNSVDPANLPWALGLFCAFMLFVAGSLPAAIADTRAERTVLAVLGALRWGWHFLRWPLVLPLLATTRLVVRMLRLQRTTKADPAEVQKQVMAAVADSVDDGSLADAERTWIGNIVQLKNTQVSKVMTPRPTSLHSTSR